MKQPNIYLPKAPQAPHSCEVTITRLDDALERYADRLSEADRIALNEAAVVLNRIAEEDRAQNGWQR